jgi:hypothetical protein
LGVGVADKDIAELDLGKKGRGEQKKTQDHPPLPEEQVFVVKKSKNTLGAFGQKGQVLPPEKLSQMVSRRLGQNDVCLIKVAWRGKRVNKLHFILKTALFVPFSRAKSPQNKRFN